MSSAQGTRSRGALQVGRRQRPKEPYACSVAFHGAPASTHTSPSGVSNASCCHRPVWLPTSSSPSQGDRPTTKTSPIPLPAAPPPTSIGPREEALQGEWGKTALRGPYRARLDERICGGGLRSLDGAGVPPACALETPDILLILKLHLHGLVRCPKAAAAR